MDILLNCCCLQKCPLTSQRGSYNAQYREQTERHRMRDGRQKHQSEACHLLSTNNLEASQQNRASTPADTRQKILFSDTRYKETPLSQNVNDRLTNRRQERQKKFLEKYASINEENCSSRDQRQTSMDEDGGKSTTDEHLNPTDCGNCKNLDSGKQKFLDTEMGNSIKSKRPHNEPLSSSSKTNEEQASQSRITCNGPVLSSFTLEGIAELINSNKIEKSSVIVLVGAGMSTSAGVPDFRSPDTGIYANLQKYQLNNPEDVFKITYFKNNPAPFYDLSRKLLPDKLYPTLAHYFVKLLDDKGYLLRCFSQNVDCLESLTGLTKEKLCLAHGSFETGHCLRCNAEYSLSWMRQIVEQGGIPHCSKTQDCKGLIKPDVKFFGERLDGRFFRLVKEDFPKCQLLIIIGSSLSVMPFAQLVQKVPSRCPRLMINKTKSGHFIPALFRIFKPSSGLMYDRKGNTRDVAYLGDCDEACKKLASLLGWHDELEAMALNRRKQLKESYEALPQEAANDET